MEETKTTLISRLRFTTGTRQNILAVWGKAGLDISCNECMETLDEEEKED